MFNGAKNYFKGLLQPDSKDSIKSFAMFCSVLVGIFLGICLGISLLFDTIQDGVLDSDLYGASAFTVSIGAMITLSGVPKMLVDKAKVEVGEAPSNRRRKKKGIDMDEEIG